jgi:hypothetical protein
MFNFNTCINMNQKYIFTLEKTRAAQRNGTLFEWTQEYLRGEGWNKGLADDLVKGKPTIIELREFPLRKLKRTMGPEKDMIHPEKEEVYEKRIAQLVSALKANAQFPPLIVTDFWKDLEIADGSHRQEALLRCGYEKYWTIFFFNKEESKRLLITN